MPAEVEVYPAMHGWCPPDSGVYSEPQAEKAWSRLLVLYGKALALQLLGAGFADRGPGHCAQLPSPEVRA